MAVKELISAIACKYFHNVMKLLTMYMNSVNNVCCWDICRQIFASEMVAMLLRNGPLQMIFAGNCVYVFAE